MVGGRFGGHVVRVVVSGVCGRTGSLVARELALAAETELVGGVEAPGHESLGVSLGELCEGAAPGAVVSDSLADLEPGSFDVIVDFSVPEQAVECARVAASLGKGLVVATTALTEKQASAVHEAAATAPVVMASNMSVGANVLFALLETAGTVLDEDFDIEIVEAHHRAKRDAPSGTALTAAAVLADARGRDTSAVLRTGRTGPDNPRGRGEIGVHSLRGGSVAGRHTVHFLSELETIAVEHVALSRRAFAVGAVRAACFAAGNGPGLYDMQDVLGLKERPAR